jgi:hypothetical protein
VNFPFDPTQGPIRVEAEVAGPTSKSSRRLLLDTGATMSLIDPAMLAVVGYDPGASTDRVQLTMGGGFTVAPRILDMRLSALGQHRFAFPLLAYALPKDAGIDGLLRLDFFRESILTVDFRVV